MQEDFDYLEKRFNVILNKLCNEYNLENIKMKFTNNLYNIQDDAEYDSKNGIILIKPIFSPLKRIQLLYHEFEHHYQFSMFTNHYNWWLTIDKNSIYNEYYNTTINIIEEDARIFGDSLGCKNGRFLFQKFPIEFFENLNHLSENQIKGYLDDAIDFITTDYYICKLLNY